MLKKTLRILVTTALLLVGAFHLFSCKKGGNRFEAELPLKSEGKVSEQRNEAWYRDEWVEQHGGQTEVTLPDGTRCDILTEEYAIEVDWARKWTEAVGQSLWYSFQTNKQPGIVLIVRTDNDLKHLLRLRSLIAQRKLDIRVWVSGEQQL